MKRRIYTLLIMLAVLGSMRVTGAAHGVPDPTREGSIRIDMDGISGGCLTVYRVGEICEDDANYSFVLTGDFQHCGISLADVNSEALAGELAQYAKKLTGKTEKIGENGKVVFEGLEPGLYLFVQEEAAPGYYKINPFLVSLPGLVDGAYIYEVNASPKVGEIRETEPIPSTKPADPTLPQTGQLNWPVAVMVTAGLTMFAAGWGMRLKRK